MSTIIVCGLTDYENKIVKEHKGECKYCIHYDSFYDGSTGNLHYRCDKHKVRIKEPKTDCKDWVLDTR